MITILTFLTIKWGDKYSAEYVNNLYGMIDANYVNQFRMVCFTDEPDGIREEVDTHPIPDVEPLHPKYWFGEENYCWDRSKFLLFNAQEWLNDVGPFCYFDLDIIIQDSIDEFYELAFQPHILYSHWQPEGQVKERRFRDIRGTYFNSSCMLWWSEQPKKIYDDVVNNPDVFKVFYKGSDNYHQWRRPAGNEFWNFLPEEWYYSYNYQDTKYDAKLALFNQNYIENNDDSISIEELEDPVLLNHWYGKYDMYKDVPTRVVLELSNKYNDTKNQFNDLFVEDDELTLEDVKRIFKDPPEYVTLLTTLARPNRCKDYFKIVEWFEQQGTQVIQPPLDFGLHAINELGRPIVEQEKEHVTRENIKKFKQKEEYRNVTKEEKWIIDCEARNDNMVYINAKGHVFPCSYIARDVLESRLFPLHPIDYPHNAKYNNAKSFPLKDIVYNADFECYNDSLKKDHLKICKETCGRCVK